MTANRQLNGNFDLLRHLVGAGWVDSELSDGFPLDHLKHGENLRVAVALLRVAEHP